MREFTIEVPTERGDIALVDVEYDGDQDTYRIAFAGGLLDSAPEGLTAVVQMALIQIAETR